VKSSRHCWALLLLVVVASITALFGSDVAQGARAQRAALLNRLSDAVLEHTNALRVRHGLAPLRVSAGLTAAAREHSREMARDGYFGHESSDGSSFDQRVARYYPSSGRNFWSVGENIVWSRRLGAAKTLKLWLRSPEHRENLLGAGWREIGIAAVRVASGAGTYGGARATVITADFGVRR
jgi:uncharacterized protein YkwD